MTKNPEQRIHALETVLSTVLNISIGEVDHLMHRLAQYEPLDKTTTDNFSELLRTKKLLLLSLELAKQDDGSH